MSSREVCTICGKKYRSARKHLARYHGISLPSDEDAISYLRIYRIFRKRGLEFPLVPLEELDFDEIFLIIRRISRIVRRPLKAVKLANPFLRELALRYPDRVLREFVNIAGRPKLSMGALAFVAITYVHRQEIVDIILEIFGRKHIHLVEYVAYAFRRYRDRLAMLIRKAAVGERRILSPYAVFQAIFYTDPSLFGELLVDYIGMLDTDSFSSQRKDFEDLFDMLVLVPRKYFSHAKTLEAFRLLANIKFFGKRRPQAPPEKIDLMATIYMVLLILDDTWSRIYYGCQSGQAVRIPEELKSGLPRDLKLYSMIRRISDIIRDYPYGRDRLAEIPLSEYLDILTELPRGYIGTYFLYLMADINAKHGLLDIAKELISIAERDAEQWYDFLPHIVLLRANIEEFLQNYGEAIRYYEKLLGMGIRWQKAIFDYIRALVLSGRYMRASEILSNAPDTIYKYILDAYIGHKTREKKREEEAISRIKDLLLTDNPEEAFIMMVAMEKICHCMYMDAWSYMGNNRNIQRIVLDTLAMACDRHFRILVEEISGRYPDDKLLRYFLGVIAIEEDNYEEALEKFMMAETCEYVDRKTLLVNMMLPALVVGRRDIIEKIAKEMSQYVEKNEYVALAMIHYYIYIGDYTAARSLLSKIEDKIDYEVYMGLKSKIIHKKFDTEYYTYILTSRITPLVTCPLLATII